MFGPVTNVCETNVKYTLQFYSTSLIGQKLLCPVICEKKQLSESGCRLDGKLVRCKDVPLG